MARRSSAVTVRFSGPTVASRRAPCPTNWAMLIDGWRALSASRYWGNVSQRKSTEAPIPPAQSLTISARPVAMGACEKEHMPTTSVVQPWRILDSADGHPK